MPTVALQSDEGELLSFLLIAGDETIADGPDERDCILTGLPPKPELLSDPLCQLVQARKNIEFRLTRSGNDSRTELRVDARPGCTIMVALSPDGSGSWSANVAGEALPSGRCKVVESPPDA